MTVTKVYRADDMTTLFYLGDLLLGEVPDRMMVEAIEITVDWPAVQAELNRRDHDEVAAARGEPQTSRAGG